MSETSKTFKNISELHNWDQNPRSITEENFDRLKKQIQKLGQYKPLLITEDGTVLGGNMRLKAYQELGVQDIWVSIVDAPTEEKKIEYALSDNDRVGQYDGEMMSNLIGNFPNVEWNDYAVDLKPPTLVEDIMDQFQEVEEDKPPAVAEGEPESKLGEVYQLGRHRLMCGDATKTEDMKLLMKGQLADMIFTDPPYNVDYEGKTKDKLKIDNDKMANDEFYNLLYNSYFVMNEFSKKGAAIYVCHADTERVNFTAAFIAAGWKLAQVIIWAKQQFVLGRQDYQWQHEPILYGWKEGAAHYFINDRTQTTLWNIDRPSQSKDHPTMKPIALIAKALENNTKEGDIVLDSFGGSGSTLIACEQTNRTCYMMELDPKYCDVIRKRYKNYLENKEKQQTT